MFRSRYRFPKLIRTRALSYHGRESGWAIGPKGLPPLPPPERIHSDSVMIPLATPHQFLVVEWTDGEPELHIVDW